MMEKSLALAKARGFKHALVIATAPGSQRICRKSEFNFINRAEYVSQPAFNGLEGSVEIYSKELRR